MSTNRRGFLKLAGGGAVAAGVIGSASHVVANEASSAAGDPGSEILESLFAANGSAEGGTPGSVDPEERRRLLAKAVFGAKEPAEGDGGMVICAQPLGTRAGTDILRAGGNAADAALATSVTQCVVEPHMTGITGVLGMLYYDAASGSAGCSRPRRSPETRPLSRCRPAPCRGHPTRLHVEVTTVREQLRCVQIGNGPARPVADTTVEIGWRDAGRRQRARQLDGQQGHESWRRAGYELDVERHAKASASSPANTARAANGPTRSRVASASTAH